MPAYDFVCESCHNEFEVWGTVEEYTKGLVHKCPFCGAKNIEQKLDSFTIMSGKKTRFRRTLLLRSEFRVRVLRIALCHLFDWD